ncbi:MAG: hybrid sensor histidine kinase/response regulator [Burkholderiales bacterium RIFCSPLOWO2_02_FULL_57_36]|nr:MAG: hybrid sensor histidine kinase/response regulator [Burkholderiales bacterium RIFCSPLOWO2_02_FULL_57_36]
MNSSTALILNVDDNDGARYAKTRTLQVAGFQVIEAANGTDALALVTEQRPDLVLLDVKLPDISGIEVCRRIKAEPASATVLVLQTSAALTGRADKIRGLEGGADNYLAAPIEADELIANVNALLRLRHTQSELRESEERFRQMAENIHDVFWIFSIAEKRLLYVSPAYDALWGASRSGLADDSMAWLDAVHSEDRERMRHRFAQLLDNQHYDEQFRVVHPDGSVRWIRDRCFFVKNPKQEIYRIARISSDISDAKDAERALQDADNHKDEFLATLAHELRSPLGPIRNAVELMYHVQSSNADTHALARKVISRQVDHLARLVDDLLDVARISKGKITLQRMPVELGMFIQAAVETTRPVIEIRNHALEVVVPDEKIWMIGDSVRLAQIVGNLLNNAAKYTLRGGKILLNAERTSMGNLRIMVQDNGIGIAEERKASIFTLFAQGDTAPDRAQDGLGIGLSLVKQLVHLHGGKIWVESAGTGKGSRFFLEFPILERELDQAQPADNTILRDAAHQALKILIVDDNVDSVNITSMLFDSLGHETLIAQDAISAMAQAKQFRPDVIVLDIGLPGVDGYELARMIREQPDIGRATLIAVTGYGTDEDKRKALEAGFDHHLVKPANLQNLLGIIKSAQRLV